MLLCQEHEMHASFEAAAAVLLSVESFKTEEPLDDPDLKYATHFVLHLLGSHIYTLEVHVLEQSLYYGNVTR